MRLLTRLKSRFGSARAAWIDIGKATGLEPKDVRSAGHTRTKWRWITSISNPKRSRTMAKKRRSAKQRANDKRLGAMARSRGRKSTPKRRRKRTFSFTNKSFRRKVNKPRRRSKSVAAKRRSSSKRGILSKIPLVNNPTVRKVATGIGLATIGATVIAIVAPQIAANPIVRPALAFIGGGIPGLIGQVVVGGGLGNFGNIFGGGNGGSAMNVSNGFA